MSTRDRTPPGAPLFYVTSGLSLLVSVNTSWRFFGEVLHISGQLERAALFSVLEMLLIACGWAMRARVRAEGYPGRAREVAWAACALSGYMAWVLSGPAEGTARVVLGPVLGLVSLHLALGIELRQHHARHGTLARVGRELRERCLSRLGLADDDRDAATRTRERATRRAARLALANHAPFGYTRLARALRTSGVAHDPAGRERMLAELAALRHAGELATLSQPSPWVASDGRPDTATPASKAPAVPPQAVVDDQHPVADTAGQGTAIDRCALSQPPNTEWRPVATGQEAATETVDDETTILQPVANPPATDTSGRDRPCAELRRPHDRPAVDREAIATGRSRPTDAYREAVTAAATDTEAVRIALTATGLDRPRDVARWITDHGRSVTAEAVRSALRRNRSQGSRETPLITLSDCPRPSVPRLVGANRL